jgi:hypothetical protein
MSRIKYPTNLIFMIAGLLLFLPQVARADFGEVDLMTRESIEIFFNSESRGVDLDRLEYVGEPQWSGPVMQIETSVWAETHRLQGGAQWAYHNCWTQIEVRAPGHYVDLGSHCELDFD